jgi:hypothetical protein
MACGEWERFVDRFRQTLAGARAFRAAGRRIVSRRVEEAAEAFRYTHKLETAAAMRRWLRDWRLTPERWRQAILLQAVQTRIAEASPKLRRSSGGQRGVRFADETSSAKSMQSKEPQIIHWLRPLGAVSGAFQELAQGFAGHAAIHDSLQRNTVSDQRSTVPEDSPLPPAGERGQGGGELSNAPTDTAIAENVNASAATYLGLGAEEVRDKAEHLLAIERSAKRFRQSVATPEAIRRQIAGNPMDWAQIRYELLTFASAAAAREAADCIRLDGDSPQEVADRAGIAMEQATRFYTELEGPLATTLLSAGTNVWIGPLEISGHHQLFRISGKTPPRSDDSRVVDRIAAYLFKLAMDNERRARVRWRLPF